MSTNRTAALRVLERVPCARNGGDLLFMLGVVAGPSGERFMPPDDVKEYLFNALVIVEAPSPMSYQAIHSPVRRRKGFTTPPGLASYSPRPPRDVSGLLERNEAKKSPCPSVAARARHKRSGEACEVCETDQQARKRKRPACGEPGGLMAHKWRDETVCEPCRLAHNAAQRARNNSQT